MVPGLYLASFWLLYCLDGMGIYSWLHFFFFVTFIKIIYFGTIIFIEVQRGSVLFLAPLC